MSDEHKMTTWQRNCLCYAIRDLSEALSTREDSYREERYRVETAEKWLKEFYGAETKIDLTEEESELSASLHAILRKACDSHPTSLLYMLIDRGIGMQIWCQFIKNLKSKLKVNDCFYYLKASSHDERLMYYAIGSVTDKEWKNILGTLKAWS